MHPCLFFSGTGQFLATLRHSYIVLFHHSITECSELCRNISHKRDGSGGREGGRKRWLPGRKSSDLESVAHVGYVLKVWELYNVIVTRVHCCVFQVCNYVSRGRGFYVCCVCIYKFSWVILVSTFCDPLRRDCWPHEWSLNDIPFVLASPTYDIKFTISLVCTTGPILSSVPIPHHYWCKCWVIMFALSCCQVVTMWAAM